MKNGFTLVELMVVAAIVGILAAVAIPLMQGNRKEADPIRQPQVQHTLRETDHVSEYTYDGCQYIVVGWGDATWGSHKGNCNNPIHQYKMEKQ